MTDVTTNTWHTLTTEQTLERLGVTKEGLSDSEVSARLSSFGPNVLQRRKKDGLVKLLARQINNPLIWALLASSCLAVALGKVTDGLVVFAVVVLNTVIGFIQEFKAGKAIEALMGMVPEYVMVLRNGEKIQIAAADLVPGDVVYLASGDKVPADMRLMEVRSLQVEEAALTGESLPVEKSLYPVESDSAIGDRFCMVYSGTLVTYGTATAVTVATGKTTELGRISDMLEEATDLETPLTKALAVIGSYITTAILVVALVMVAVGLWRAMGQGIAFGEAFRESVIFAIALAVGAIPEGLPAIVTIALAIGVQRMAARKAIIRRLPAVETLGSTTVICSDKTGTLTRNEMTVQQIVTTGGVTLVSGRGYDPVGDFSSPDGTTIKVSDEVKSLLQDAVLCSDATLANQDERWTITGDPTEAALVVALEKTGISPSGARSSSPRLDVIPFESDNQYMASLNRMDSGQVRLVIKGAPEVILAKCNMSGASPMLHEIERMAGEGMRVLGFAYKELPVDQQSISEDDAESGFTFSGLVGMIDPPRQEVIESIRKCKAAGITVKMITGDHKLTAKAIGSQLGILDSGEAITGSALSGMDNESIQHAVAGSHVFARVAPEHKLSLVRALQSSRQIVAMTGDGVNDAPALKQADIGVAMGITGTSVSKESADIVLTDDNFASISAAVEEGRRVYDNLIKSLAFVLPTNLGLAFILMFAVAFFPFDPQTGSLLVPMLPTQLLWINLVATVSLALPLAFEAMEPDLMQRPPRSPDEPVLNRFVLIRTLVAAILMSAGAIGLFQYEYTTAVGSGIAAQVAQQKAQTMAVTTVIMFQIFYLLNCRSLKDSILKIGLFSNPFVFVGIAVVTLLQAAFIYTEPMHAIFSTMPLSMRDVALSVAVGAIILPVITFEKWFLGRKRRQAAVQYG